MRISTKFLFFSLFLLFSCTSDAEYYNEIVGEWNCTSWVPENSSQNKCNNNAYFKFNEDRTYRSKLGGEEDQGNYTIERGKLMAHPDGKMVIGVKIVQLENDTLKLLMNNGGIKETLQLLKVN